MSDKNLTELEWKRFAKGRNLKDAALVKGLAELERAKTPDAQLTALADIEKQSDLLLKANKGDKELAQYLGDTGKAIDKQRKLSEFESRKSAKTGGDEDDEGPAALGARMLPLLRQIAKGEDGGAMPAMVAVAGKEVAVLVARRAIGASQKKLLTEALGTSAGVKFMSGECVWEGNAHTFVLEAKVSNLAKGIKAALKKQTDTSFKVRLRGADPHDVDEDGEEGGSEGHETEAEAETEDSPEKGHYLERLRELEPQVNTALRELTGDTPKLKAVFGFAQGKAKEGQFAAALQGLEMVAKLLTGPGTVPTAPPLPPTSTTTSKPETPHVEPGDEIKKFTERVNALLPRIKDGLAASAPGAAGAKLKLSEAAVFTRKHDWPAAYALLDEIERELKADAPLMPRELSPKEGEIEALKKKRELEDRWRQVAPNNVELENKLGELIRSGDVRMADVFQQQLTQMREARSNGDLKTALEVLACINALTGSPESTRAELKQMSLRESPSYKATVDQQNAGLTPEDRERFRKEAAEDGYGLTSDGMTRYALPISAAEWQKGALAPLPKLAQLLEQAATKSAQLDGGPLAALPFIDEIFNAQHPLKRLAERAQQYAIDGGFAEQPRVEQAALELHVLFGHFADAIQPFVLGHAQAKGADELLRRMEELAPTLKDYPAPEHGQGGTPSAQLQQAIEAFKAGEFSPAGALLLAIRNELYSNWPEGTPGDGINEQIAKRGEESMRGILIAKLSDTAQELDILAAQKGLPFDTARAALLKLDQAVRAFEAML